MFKPVNPRVNIQELEKEQLEFWRQQRIFERTLEEREGAPEYVFYEGPPTANGKPGSHHVLARAFKDMFPRYKVMRGYHVIRRGGWDTHGLPVEIAVQKELGLKSKRDIEEYGIAEFNERCRTNVFRNITDWEKLTERIAFWVDLDNAYITFTNDYIESVWWILKQLWDKGLLYRGYKVVPYSPTSGTPLSSHEVSLGYKEVDDPSVFVRFPLRDKPGVYLLAWTTTPWTLPGNVALAVNENIEYVQVEGPTEDGEGTEQLILAAALMEKVLEGPEHYKVVKHMKGKDLLGLHYSPLYTFLPVDQDYCYVVAGDFVSIEDGTGIVHMAPAFGQDDKDTADKYGLPMLVTVGADGKFIDQVTKFRGLWFKDADPEIIKDLRDRGLLYRVETYTHNYPHNWRDDTPLMYYARETWFIRATDYKDKMVALNKTINWTPSHIRDGRFGNWLEELKDWALGRERFWGTPLPVWVDDETGDMICVGSVEELSQLTGRDLSDLDLHRPYVDEITFPNPKGTGGTMRRVPEVIDVWFDSGAMPVAQWGYPAQDKDKMFERQHPADYICEAVDQTRGWFYSLHAISTMLFEKVAYKNVICLGHILDENGQKMSKSKGNIVDPWAVLDEHGADAFRWYLYTASPPGESRRFSVNLVGEVVKKFWSTLWNTYSFFVTYANLDGWTPDSEAPPVEERDLLDRWVLAELHQLVKRVTDAYENYDATNATRPIEEFVEQLSNWYVRLSRRRFWKAESDTEKQGAYATLYECLVTIAKLLAPTMPFLSEAMYRNLVVEVSEGEPESIHLSTWPAYEDALIDETLLAEMDTVQRLVRLGLAARNEAKIRVRQPLAKASFALPDSVDNSVLERYADLIQSELNVKALEVIGGEKASALMNTVYSLNPIPAKLGKKFGGDFPRVQKALREGEQDTIRPIAEALLAGKEADVVVDGDTFTVTPEEVEVKASVEMAEGFCVVNEGDYWAVLDITLTDDLLKEGLAREVVRRIQNMRRDAGFNIDDKIEIVYSASEQLTEAMQTHADYISAETLALRFEAGDTENGGHTADFKINGEALTLSVKRVDA
ncbi:MAG: isoleucine--tRNA ligase [Chloroflexi bacterium]|nr:MAG: isoleucine--tRNA ligase [Chloroflexota bacterium]